MSDKNAPAAKKTPAPAKKAAKGGRVKATRPPTGEAPAPRVKALRPPPAGEAPKPRVKARPRGGTSA